MAKPQLETKRPRVALIGADTLLGRDVQEVLASRAVRPIVSTFSATGEGSFGEQEGESVYIQPLEADALHNQRAVFLAGAADGARKAYDLIKRAGGVPTIIDCNGHLESQPEARIVSPLQQPSTPAPGAWLYIVAHPAATALAIALTRLNRVNPVRQAVVHIFEPASERDTAGVSELHHQTTNLLSFKPLDKQIFDAQLSFNLLAQYGEEAPSSLASIEQRVERHVATLLAASPQDAPIPMPSLRLLQAPVFHGYSLSLWIQFERPADVTADRKSVV